MLQEENFRNAVVRKRTVLVDVERLVELGECARQITLLHECLTTQNTRTQTYIGRILQQAIVGIDADPSWTAKSVERKSRVGSRDVDALSLRLSVGIDLQLHRHAEQIKILVYLPNHPKALVIPETIDRVLGLKFWRACGIQPLREE